MKVSEAVERGWHHAALSSPIDSTNSTDEQPVVSRSDDGKQKTVSSPHESANPRVVLRLKRPRASQLGPQQKKNKRLLLPGACGPDTEYHSPCSGAMAQCTCKLSAMDSTVDSAGQIRDAATLQSQAEE